MGVAAVLNKANYASDCSPIPQRNVNEGNVFFLSLYKKET